MDKVGELKTIMNDQVGEACSTAEFIDYLVKCGLIECKQMFRYLIKHEYYKRLKKQDANCFTIKMDLSVEYDVSKATIENIIYKYDHISV